jgi:hypothetical protein
MIKMDSSDLIHSSLFKVKRQSNLKTIEQYHAHSWLKTHGKITELNKKQQNDLKYLFNELDSDKSGVVSTEELFEMLLSLGLVSRKSEVETLVKYASSKTSGVLRFDEFVKLFVRNEGNLFKKNTLDRLVNSVAGNLKRLKNRDLPLSISLCNRKRSLMMQAYVGENFVERDKGMKLISAFASEANSPKSPSKEERISSRNMSDFQKLDKTRVSSLPKKISDSFMNYLPPVNIRRKHLRRESRLRLMNSFNSLTK